MKFLIIILMALLLKVASVLAVGHGGPIECVIKYSYFPESSKVSFPNRHVFLHKKHYYEDMVIEKKYSKRGVRDKDSTIIVNDQLARSDTFLTKNDTIFKMFEGVPLLYFHEGWFESGEPRVEFFHKTKSSEKIELRYKIFKPLKRVNLEGFLLFKLREFYDHTLFNFEVDDDFIKSGKIQYEEVSSAILADKKELDGNYPDKDYYFNPDVGYVRIPEGSKYDRHFAEFHLIGIYEKLGRCNDVINTIYEGDWYEPQKFND